MSDALVPEAIKAKKLRSPSYPSIDLASAVKRAEAFYDKERRNAAPLRVALGHWGISEKSSAGLLTVAALKSFGLLNEAEGADRRIQLTELSLRIILDKREGSAERAQAIKRAALMPKMHQNLWAKYGEDLPSEENLAHELVFDWKFNENAVRDFIREYKITIQYAKLTNSDRQSTVPLGTIEDESADDSGAGAPMEQAAEIQRGETTRGTAGFIPPAAKGVRQDVFSLTEGPVSVQWPASISPDSFQDLADWLDILKRKIGRSVVKPENGVEQ